MHLCLQGRGLRPHSFKSADRRTERGKLEHPRVRGAGREGQELGLNQRSDLKGQSFQICEAASAGRR